MQQVLEQALQHLDNARIAECFATLSPIVPQDLLYEFNLLRNTLIQDMQDVHFISRIRLFIDKLKENLPTEKTDSPAEVVLPTFTLADFQNLDLSHALRPELTRLYVRKLAFERQCLNIYGESGTGKGRMLADIARSGLPNAIFVQAQIQRSFDLFLEEIAQELQTPKQAKLKDIIEPVAKRAGKTVFLLMRGIDRLYDQAGIALEGYDDFFIQLNGLRNNPLCRVACVTHLDSQQSYDTVSSPLKFDRVKLKELAYAEIEAELQRNLPVSPDVLAYLAEQFDAEPTPYDLLHALTDEQPTLNTQEDAKRILKDLRRKIR